MGEEYQGKDGSLFSLLFFWFVYYAFQVAPPRANFVYYNMKEKECYTIQAEILLSSSVYPLLIFDY